jgi:ribosome-binding protein aMBF1 (putative translation factor)
MKDHCQICGRPLSVLDQVLAERDPLYQCHHCWNRVQATGAGIPPRMKSMKNPRIVSRDRRIPRTPKVAGRK